MAIDINIVIADVDGASVTVAFYFDVVSPLPEAIDPARIPHLTDSLPAPDLAELKAGTSFEIVQGHKRLKGETKGQLALRLLAHHAALDGHAQIQYGKEHGIKSYIGTKHSVSGGWI